MFIQSQRSGSFALLYFQPVHYSNSSKFFQFIKNATINHVSLFDDTLGYDVEVRLDGIKALCFEVKTTTRSSIKFPFFLSRNEAKVAAALPNLWFLGLVQILDGVATVIGTSSFDTLMPRMPVDKSDDVAWASVSCTFDTSELQSLELCLKHALTQSS